MCLIKEEVSVTNVLCVFWIQQELNQHCYPSSALPFELIIGITNSILIHHKPTLCSSPEKKKLKTKHQKTVILTLFEMLKCCDVCGCLWAIIGIRNV